MRVFIGPCRERNCLRASPNFCNKIGPLRHLARRSDPVAFGGIVLQNLNVFAEGGRPGVFAWHFFRSPDEGAAAATRRHHLLTHQLRRTSRRRDWRRTAEELDQTPQVLRGCGQ